ncbi:ABC transporter permease subunit [Breoghania sp.]|uniref:ABC transporter permease subunit n=1 Tax=Breoghania sp. TaxID=2065378 RepID=UPI00261192D6|nr:ABC transporter permease subunit [Breoghania sp.]MDJ0931711.1 ABC transporter permease subunit [Breoghania sp.]
MSVLRMTSASDRKPVAGRSLTVDALRRLSANRATMASLIFLALMAIVCIIGPHFTGHAYDEVYQSYVRVPASLEPYPHQDAVASALKKALSRARLDLGDVVVSSDTAEISVLSPRRPLDERVTRYVERNDLFSNARLTDVSDDGHAERIVADIARTRFLFGTDLAGRDLLTRTLVAGRISLTIGLLATLVAMVIGVTWGASAGYLGGAADAVMMRIVDVLYALPFIFFVILLVVFFGRNFVLMFLAVGAVEWLYMARIVRGQTLSLKQREFVEAAEALGVTGPGILKRHIIPNLAGPVIVYMTLLVPKVILLESFLSFLGLGVQEPMTSWGVLIAEGARSTEAMPDLLLFPAAFLTSTLFALNFVGDGLCDALDPKER